MHSKLAHLKNIHTATNTRLVMSQNRSQRTDTKLNKLKKNSKQQENQIAI